MTRFRTIRNEAIREALAARAAPDDIARALGASVTDVDAWSREMASLPAQRPSV